MEWEVWLEKGKKINRAKKIIRDAFTIPDVLPIEIKHVDGTYTRGDPVNNDDIETHHAHKKSWESWLEKEDKEKKKKPTMFPRIRREFEDEKDEEPMVYNKNAAWESWLDKNNGIETSHKEGEKKEEWDGKFSSSTIRDDAENDDDKAVSEEESLEELTDGKLEEIEKLKSWEVFLDKTSNQYPQDKIPEKKDEDGDIQINHETGTKLNEDGTITDSKQRKIEDEGSSDNLTTRFSRGNLRGKKIGAGKIGYTTATEGGGVPKGWAGKYGKGGNSFGSDQWGGTMSGDSARPNADGTRTTLDGLRQQIQRINEHENKKELSATGQPAAAHQKEVADIENVGKSWELFLEKGITYRDPNKTETDPKKIRENALIASKKPVIKSWSEWLEKMQGAGDARFGNQHLTGMEQHPVADDDSLELSPETEENNEKEDKKEDKEEEDNKPYKALR